MPSPLQRLRCRYDGDFYLMDLSRDRFVHFTTRDRAAERRLGMTDLVEALKAHLRARGVPPAQARALCDAAARLVGEAQADQTRTAAGPQSAS